MVARFTGASLGLLAFTITVIGGLFVQNPLTVTLSRSVFALFVFCLLGLVLGAMAQRVVDEYETNQREEILKRYREESVDSDEAVSVVDTTGPGDRPVGP